MKTILMFFYKNILGWSYTNTYPKHLKKYLIIAAPHTSAWDFVLGMLVKYSLGIPTNYIGRDGLFKPPFGFIFKWLGGAPVDRSKSNNLVSQIVATFNSKDKFILAMSPEGTRKKTDKWKTGFYYIAKGAKVPIVMIALDFEHKNVKFSDPYYTTDDRESDFKYLHNFYKDIKGRHPELF